MTRAPNPELMTTAEVAKLCGVHISTVKRWADEGKISPAVVTLGGKRRYNTLEIKKFKQRRSHG